MTQKVATGLSRHGETAVNRCITCNQRVSSNRAQNVIFYKGHRILVCGLLCQAAFKKDPERFVAISKILHGSFGESAYGQTIDKPGDSTNGSANSGKPRELLDLMNNLSTHSRSIRNEAHRLEDHFDTILNLSRTADLISAVEEHQRKLSTMRVRLSALSGACSSLLSIVRTEGG